MILDGHDRTVSVARVTLSQVAEAAGVSKATAGYILRGKGELFTPEMRALVTRTASTLGYRPNAAARATSLGRFNAVGVIHSSVGWPRSILSPSLLTGLQRGADAAGMTLTTAAFDDATLSDAERIPSILQDLAVDGLVMNYAFEVPPRLVALLDQARIPVVWMNIPGKWNVVRPDDHQGAAAATQHLLALGHRDIAYVDDDIGTDDDAVFWHYSMRDREAGYRATMTAADLPARVIRPPFRIQPVDRARACASWLAAADRPTAVVCYSTLTTHSLLLAAARLGLTIPRQLSLITFASTLVDGLDIAVDTMEVPDVAVGEAAVAMVQRLLSGTPRVAAHALPMRVLPGRSCTPPC